MYCLVLIISLAMAAPRVSRNCYTLCDLQKSHPANEVPRGCNCSLSDLINAESSSKEIKLLDDTGVYFVPAEVDLFQTYFIPQPFQISNPVKFVPRIKKGTGATTDFSEELSERIETYESRKTLIRVSNNDESQAPTYLDLEIQDVTSSETSVIQHGHFIQNFESAEQALVECLDLHILDFTRKYGSVESFNEFWEARNLKIYEDLSNSDLNDKIKKYCSETEFLIEQSLEDIKRGVPKKKTIDKNFRYVHEDDDDIKHEAKDTAKPDKLNLDNIEYIDRKYESSLERSSSLGFAHHTGLPMDNINELKRFVKISNKSKNISTDVTAVTAKNTTKAYDTESDMETIPSDVIFKTLKEINESDFDLVTNKYILDETESLPISTTPLSDVLYFGDTSGNTEKPFVEIQEERTDVGNLDTTPFGVNNLGINNGNNKNTDDIIRNELTSALGTPASTTPLTEEQSLRDIGDNTERSLADTEEHTIENIDLDFDAMRSEDISKPNLETKKSNVNVSTDQPILDNISFLPASTTPKHGELALGNIGTNSETSTLNKNGEGKNDEIYPHFIVAGTKPTLENITFLPSTTTPQHDKVSVKDINDNSATSMAGKEAKGKDGDRIFDLNTMPSGIIVKPNNEIIKPQVNVAGKELKLDEFTDFTTPSTSIENEKLSLGTTIGINSETTMTEKEANGEDKETKLDFVTPSPEIILKPSKDIFKLRLNIDRDEPILHEVVHLPTVSTSPQNEKVSVENASSSTERSITGLREKHAAGDTNLDLNTMASNMILNMASNGPISDETPKFVTTPISLLKSKQLVNVNEDTTSNISSDDDTTSVSYMSTTPVTAILTRRQKLSESEVQIPKIITKECQNNRVQSFINGNEELPNNDFKPTDEKTKQDCSDDSSKINCNSTVKAIDTTAVFNNSYISGNLYFGSSQELVPVRLLQTDSGTVSLGIDGHSLCEQFLQKPNGKSLLLSTLCNCVHQMPKNNETDVS